MSAKTTIARQLIPALEKQGLSLCIRKPVESGCFVKADQLCPQDAAILAAASQTKPALADVCPYRFQAAASPARAAQLTGTSLTLDDLAASCNTPEGHFLIVEGAGSFYSPLTSDNKLNAALGTATKPAATADNTGPTRLYRPYIINVGSRPPPDN